MSLPESIWIREVGPRDGLQGEAPLPVDARIRLIEGVVAAGARQVEAVSFVSPKAVPAMAGAGEVLAGLERVEGVQYLALVPNRRGAEMALSAGVDGLTVTVSASAAYNEKNVHMTIDQSVDEVASICALAGSVWVEAVVSCAFGSPYEGDVEPGEVAALGSRLMSAGCTALTLADTTGMATPRRIADVVSATGPAIGLHLHDTRGTALVNAYAAMELCVRQFDTAIGGLGGSPFAAGAGGNLATEALVHLCHDLDVATGFDLDRLLEVGDELAAVIHRPLPSALSQHGPRWRLTPA